MPVFNQSRSRIIRLIFLAAFFVILAQLFHLQILSGEYQKQANDNAIFANRVYPERGIIFDRKNRAILNNTRMFDLMVNPSKVKGIDTSYFCKLMELDTAEFKRRIDQAVAKNGGSRVRSGVFEELLTPQKYARMQENMWRFSNGFFLQQRPVRTYPYNAAAHVLGYVTQVDSSIIGRSNGFYQPGDYSGRTGLEQYYEKVLMGQRGMEYFLKDNFGRIIGRCRNGEIDTPAIAGRSLHTYLDVDVQQLAEKLLRNKIGAIVAVEPKTGGIIAMASGPDYNPNDLTGPEKQKNYSKMVLDVSRPLFNRAIKGQYPPGSTYKPLEALIGLNEGVITPRSSIGCTGVYYGCNRPVKCTEHWAGHAANLRLAIAYSCNSFFSNGFRLIVDNPQIHNVRKGLTKWKEYMNAFGYGHRTGVDLASEDGGNIPDTTAYDKDYRGQWNSCTMVTLGIGQDKMLATPLQIVNGICIVANKGYYYVPHFVKSIEGESEDDSSLLNKYRAQHKVLTHISDSVYNVVINGMHDVTEVGTAAGVTKIPGIEICAKTGTAQNKIVLDRKVIDLKDHSLFVCFAPKDNPKIAVAVIVENGGWGATWAAPMGYLIVEKYLTDSLRAERVQEADRIANANLLPSFLSRQQFIEDSIRAFQWFKMTKDSSYIEKYISDNWNEFSPQPQKQKPLPAGKERETSGFAIVVNEREVKKKIQPALIS